MSKTEMTSPQKRLVFAGLTLSDLPHRRCGVIRGPSSTRPILWVLEENNIRVVVKDYSANGFLFRNIIGRFLVWREYKAYRRLKGLEGVPVFYGTIGGLAVVFEELPGRNVEGLEHETRLPEKFFQDLRALVERIHKRGLAHCDLKRAPNTIIGPDEKPYIVDWSAAIAHREFRFFPLNLIYQRFIQDDFNAIIKLQLRHCPESIDPEERTRYFHRGPVERAIRSIRDGARDILQKIA
ncbi:MAG: hypothetical protein JRG79_15755 [Deltaproteobacteria bacterium]|nr:hypothetical protein [Deltaproteobacteria bacterium]MBW2208362.1 hypothetical protein [Deltaproteobacteria bacterium]